MPSREVVYIPRHDTFLMIADNKEGGELAIWSLDPDENLFRKLTLASDLKEPLRDLRVSQGLQYDDASDLCYYIQKQGNGVPDLYAFRYVPEKK